ncbi:MAG: hypothetical protein QNK04_27275 [Myxococcota bacterium]|nr:hypothetical protein [Myxococcota bacterium]
MSRRLAIASGLAVAATLAFLLWPDGPAEDRGGVGEPAPAGAAEEPSDDPPLDWRADVHADHAIASGETLQIETAELPADRPLLLQLVLGEPSRDLEARPVRVIAPDGRLLHTRGPVDERDRLSAMIEIEPEWLKPGRYIVEVKTTEKTHFPLRRYALEVR